MTCSIVHCAAHKQILIKSYLNVIMKNREKTHRCLQFDWSPILQQLQIIRVEILPKDKKTPYLPRAMATPAPIAAPIPHHETGTMHLLTIDLSFTKMRDRTIGHTAVYTRFFNHRRKRDHPPNPMPPPMLKIPQFHNPPISQSLHPHTLTSPNPVNPQCLACLFYNSPSSSQEAPILSSHSR